MHTLLHHAQSELPWGAHIPCHLVAPERGALTRVPYCLRRLMRVAVHTLRSDQRGDPLSRKQWGVRQKTLDVGVLAKDSKTYGLT